MNKITEDKEKLIDLLRSLKAKGKAKEIIDIILEYS